MKNKIKNPGSIYFFTKQDVTCIRFYELFQPHLHVLPKNTVYKMTSPKFQYNGDLKFSLYDYQGYIGTYIIPDSFVDLIQETTKKHYKTGYY
jgi:hypothetical protein